MTTKNFKILDCTFRDGGYYTNWNFDTNLVRSLVKTLDKNKVDIIELGYKSPIKGGPYRKCNDGFVKKILDFEISCKLSFMIDAKDFISGYKSIDFELMNDCISDKKHSIFDICRLAIKSEEIDAAVDISRYILDKGYKLCVNLMAVSLLKQNQINYFIKKISPYADTLYVADSYGNLIPDTVAGICSLFSTSSNGIHCHDNLGLAFANSLEAIKSGFDHIDSTMLGMGRGVGNTKTEQLLLYRNNNITHEVLDLISVFKELQQIHKWGFNSLYMIGGINHIHPLYLQNLNLSSLNSKKLLATTEKLKNMTSYNSDKIESFKEQKAVVIIPARYKSSRFPGKPLAKIHGKEMVLHVAEKAEKAVGKNNVYIATENDEISSVVKKAGYRVVLTSDNCITGTDRIAEASLEIDADIFINVQGDEPMINPQDIIKTIELKKQNPDCVINCMARLNHDEDYNDKKIPKVVCDLNNLLLYSSRNALPGSKSGMSKKVMKQVCIYAFSKNDLAIFHSNEKTPLEYQEDIEILRFVEKGIKVKMLEVDSVSYAVDYPEDIAIIETKYVI